MSWIPGSSFCFAVRSLQLRLAVMYSVQLAGCKKRLPYCGASLAVALQLRLAVKYGFLHHAVTENKGEDDKNNEDPNANGGTSTGAGSVAGAGVGADSQGRTVSPWASLSHALEGGAKASRGSRGPGASGAGLATHVALDVDPASAVADGAPLNGAGNGSRGEAETSGGARPGGGAEEGKGGLFGWLRRRKKALHEDIAVARATLDADSYPVSAVSVANPGLVGPTCVCFLDKTQRSTVVLDVPDIPVSAGSQTHATTKQGSQSAFSVSAARLLTTSGVSMTMMLCFRFRWAHPSL